MTSEPSFPPVAMCPQLIYGGLTANCKHLLSLLHAAAVPESRNPLYASPPSRELRRSLQQVTNHCRTYTTLGNIHIPGRIRAELTSLNVSESYTICNIYELTYATLDNTTYDNIHIGRMLAELTSLNVSESYTICNIYFMDCNELNTTIN